MRHSVQVLRCTDVTIVIPGKFASLSIDSCHRARIVCAESVISSVEVVNCSEVSVAVRGSTPTFTVDLSSEIAIELWNPSTIISSSATTITVRSPDGWFYSVPDRYRTTFAPGLSRRLVSRCDEEVLPENSLWFWHLLREETAAAIRALSVAMLPRIGTDSPAGSICRDTLQMIASFLIEDIEASFGGPGSREPQSTSPPTQVRRGNTVYFSGFAAASGREMPIKVDSKPGDVVVISNVTGLCFEIESPAKSVIIDGCLRVFVSAAGITNHANVVGSEGIELAIASAIVPPSSPPGIPVVNVCRSKSVQLDIPRSVSVVTNRSSTVNMIEFGVDGAEELAIPEQWKTVVDHPKSGWTTKTTVLRRQ